MPLTSPLLIATSETRAVLQSFAAAGGGGAEEFFLCLEPAPGANFRAEAMALLRDYLRLLREQGLDPSNALWLRFYLSEIRAQAPALRRILADFPIPGAPALLGQPPLRGGRLALEARLIRGATARPYAAGEFHGNQIALKNYKLVFGESAPATAAGAGGACGAQSRECFAALRAALASKGMSLADHLLRTWIYVRGIDHHYREMSEARNVIFREVGLTAQTHFAASTGIEGDPENEGQQVRLDALLAPGLDPRQVEFMTAPTHMPPTHTYGVSFERGARVRFGDRSHYYLSGTASIGPDGSILYPGEVRAQTRRMVENVRALLENHGARLEDLKLAMIYLRDPAHAPAAEETLAGLLPAGLPSLLVRAPVCRPGWLIEMEGLAINASGDPRFPAFA